MRPSFPYHVLVMRGVAIALVALGIQRPTSIADAAPQDQAEAEHHFETRIRPVLVEHCLKCHGPSDSKAGLRLDSREAALKGGDIGPAVVPGNVEESLLIGAITHTDEFIKMPPGGEKLPDEVIADLTEWVQAGAHWPESAATADQSELEAVIHWAFQPVQKSEPPAAADSDWSRNPIDAFLFARLADEGLTPSPEADRRTLIRRLTFDLTGLPPTPEAIEAFLSDEAPDAYARLVDRLLASPRYGERWGRHWLDVARYADTKGYVFQEERRYPFAYTYRDYVIRAFNEDKPYNQFILEQLAADQLRDNGKPADLAAMGFLTVGRRFLNKQEDIIDDRIDVTSRGLLGLTVSCARCHDHKYDPIPAEDYYSLYGVFASSEEPQDLPLIAEGTELGSEDYRSQRRERVEAVQSYLNAKRTEFTNELTNRLDDYLAAAVQLDLDAGHADFDSTARAGELHPRLLRHAMQRWRTWTNSPGAGSDPWLRPWSLLGGITDTAEFTGKVTEVSAAPGVELASGAADPARSIVHAELFGGEPLSSRIELARRYGKLLTKAATEPQNADLAPLRLHLESPEGLVKLPDNEREFVRLLERDDRNKFQELQRNVAQLDATHPGAPPKAMVMVDKATPFDPYVFQRGNPGRRGQDVPRRFLKVLSGPDRQPFQNGSGRLDLAQAIANPENPLTARVLVNRVWMHHFDQPLVNTPSDFGFRSDPPTHPELLDWLAATFIEDGWSIKSLHRRIVLSQAYRQQSLDRPDGQAIDPENALLWKQNRKRLELEPLRDAMLAVSDHLDLTMGGRSVDITDAPYSARRAVYAFIDRQNLPGLFRTFDLASPDASTPQRYRTTVPQQALYLMNNPFVAEQARHLVGRLEREGLGAAEERVQALFGWLYGRQADPGELDLATRFVDSRDQSSAEPVSVWRYGYGAFDTSSNRVAEFTAFPEWSNGAWQFGAKVPHPEFQYLHLKAEGGHVGNDPQHAVILRWVAPQDAVIAVEVTIGHENDQGDGVRGRVVASRSGLLGETVAHHGEATIQVDRYEVSAGETIDFVVDCQATPDFDSFRWAPTLRVVEAPAEAGLATSWNAKDEFHGPLPPRLGPWEQLAQVLLLSNEFIFVD